MNQQVIVNYLYWEIFCKIWVLDNYFGYQQYKYYVYDGLEYYFLFGVIFIDVCYFMFVVFQYFDDVFQLWNILFIRDVVVDKVYEYKYQCDKNQYFKEWVQNMFYLWCVEGFCQLLQCWEEE